MYILKRLAMVGISLGVLAVPFTVHQESGHSTYSLNDEKSIRHDHRSIAAEQKVRQERTQEYLAAKVIWDTELQTQANWEQLRISAAREQAQRQKAAAVVNQRRQSPDTTSETGSGRCGGDLPPCYIMMRESRGDIRAENPDSSASGKWQFMDGTWNGYGGYAHASDAPESVQDARAREVWAGGRGASHWACC